MSGLFQKPCTFVESVVAERKTIDLILLKISCKVHIKEKVFTRIYSNYHDVWNNQVVLVSWKSLEAVALIETHRRCYNQFDNNMKDALEYINTNHTPVFKKLDPVSHGRENIRSTPTKNLEPWNFLTGNPR